MTLLQTPPFHKIPVRRGHFNHLAYSPRSESKQSSGGQKGEVIARIHEDIREVLSKLGKLGASITARSQGAAGQDEGGSREALREVAELVEVLAVEAGAVEWLAELGRSPYVPVYPPNLEEGDLINLREKLLRNELPSEKGPSVEA